MSNKIKTSLFIVITLLNIAGLGILFLLYGPNKTFRDFYITSVMTTLEHKYLAKVFYSNQTIETVMRNNFVAEVTGDTDLNKIDASKPIYKSIYDKQIMDKDINNPYYKIIDVKGPSFIGYLSVIYQAEKLIIGTAQNLGKNGASLTKIAKSYNARLAVNGGGFAGNVKNRRPAGDVISQGELVYSAANPTRTHYIGLTRDNKLYLSRNKGADLLKQGVRDAVSFGPFLIVNGKPSIVNGNGGWGYAPRTAIGQRQDGIILLLIIDGRQAHSLGASLKDVIDIMQKYGAYNAANLDGGSSSGLFASGTLINKPSGDTPTGERNIPNAFVLLK